MSLLPLKSINDDVSRISIFSIIFSAIFVMCISCALIFYTVPVADDFCRASITSNWYDYVINTYFNWTGRWAAQAFYGSVFPHLGILSFRYPLGCAIIFLAIYLAFFSFLSIVVLRQVSLGLRLLLTVIVTALYWAGMQNPGQTIYWLTGSIEYSLPFALSIFAITLLIKSSTDELSVIKRIGLVAISYVFLLIIPGLHEIAGIVLIIVMAAAGFIAIRVRSDYSYLWFIAFILIVTSTMFSTFAPGNAIRAEKDLMEYQHSSFTQHISSFFTIQTTVLGWLLDAKILLASLFLGTSQWLRRIKPDWIKWDTVNWKKITLVVWSGCIIVICVLLAWKVGSPPDRLYNFIYGVFLVGWFITIFAWTRDNTYNVDSQYYLQLHKWAGLAFSLSLLLSSNTERAVRDFIEIQNNVIGYKLQMHKRYQQLISAKADNQSTVTVQHILMEPRSFFYPDIEADPSYGGYWRNECVAAYFGLSNVQRTFKTCKYQDNGEIRHLPC